MILINESHKHEQKEQNLKHYFPDFLLLLRDCEETTEDDDEVEVSTIDFINKHVLVTRDTHPLSTKDKTVNSILTSFPSVTCKVLPNPGRSISQRNKVLEPFFVQKLQSVIQYILCNTQPKQMHGGDNSTFLDGMMLASLLEEYVKALNTPGTIPNLEMSYQAVIDTTLKLKVDNLKEKYSEQMEILLENCYPIEEGEISILQQTHASRIEESVKGILQTSDYEQMNPDFTSLYEIHDRVYSKQLAALTAEIHKLIPVKFSVTEEKKENHLVERKRQMLKQFELKIIDVKDGNIKVGTLLHTFIKKNREKSEVDCKRLFDRVYRQQESSGSISQAKLKSEYNSQAKGPAKDQVFCNLSSEIPGPPQQVLVDNVTDHSATLSWSKPLMHSTVTTVTYYETMYYTEEKGGTDSIYNIFYDTCTVLRGLRPKTRYKFLVRGVNSLDNRKGEYIKPKSIETKAGKPDMPDTPTITPETDETCKVEVKMLPQEKENGSPVKNIIITQYSDVDVTEEKSSFDVSSMKRGSHLCQTIKINCRKNMNVLWCYVQFENEAGVSGPSKAARLHIEDMIPSKPQNVNVKTKARELQLNWEPPKNNPGAVKYYLVQYWMKQTGQNNTPRMDKDVSEANLLLIECLLPSTEYSIRICAKNARNQFNEYTHVDIKTKADVPSKPQIHNIRTCSATRVIITMFKPTKEEENGSKVEEVIVEKKERIAGPDAVTKSDWKKFLKPHPIEKLPNDLECFYLEIDIDNFTENVITSYRVKSKNEVGESEASKSLDLHPESIIPGKPEDFKHQKVFSNSITLFWREPKINPLAAKQYRVQFKAGTDTQWTSKLVDSEKGNMQATFTELRPDNVYKFIVQAINGSLFSEESFLDIRTLPSVPPKPRPPIAIPQGNSFKITTYLPPIEASGREVTEIHLYVCADYSTERIEAKKMKVMKEKITKRESERLYEEEMEINIEGARWISVKLSNAIGMSEESDLVRLSSTHQQELSKLQDQLIKLAEDNTRLSEQLKKERQDADNKIARLGEELKEKCQSHQILFDQAIRVQQRLDQKLRKDMIKLQVQS